MNGVQEPRPRTTAVGAGSSGTKLLARTMFKRMQKGGMRDVEILAVLTEMVGLLTESRVPTQGQPNE